MAQFNFAPDSHVAIETAPEEQAVTTFNGWTFSARPATPYVRKFTLRLSGMYWRQDPEDGTLDVATDPETNVGALLAFYREHRQWKVFEYEHEYLGVINCRFVGAVNVPEAIPNAGGLVPTFEITMIHHDPGY
jgi:hypothetical protein